MSTAVISPRQLTATIVVCASDALETWRASWSNSLGRYLICDGTADDVEIQAALNALPNNTGNVHLSTGKFYIASPIVMGPRQWLDGEGMGYPSGASTGITELVASGAIASVLSLTTYSPPGGYHVSDLVINGAGVATDGLYLQNVISSYFERLAIWNCTNASINYRGNNIDNTFDMVKCEASAYGLLTSDTGGVNNINRFYNCSFRVCSTAGIYSNDTNYHSEFSFDGCYIESNAKLGALFGRHYNLAIMNTYFENNNTSSTANQDALNVNIIFGCRLSNLFFTVNTNVRYHLYIYYCIPLSMDCIGINQASAGSYDVYVDLATQGLISGSYLRRFFIDSNLGTQVSGCQFSTIDIGAQARSIIFTGNRMDGIIPTINASAQNIRFRDNYGFTSEASVRNSAQFDKTNDTALATITGLSVDMSAGQVYEFEATLFVNANVAGGTKYCIDGTCTATAIIYEVMLLEDATLAYTIASRQTALGGVGVGQTGTTAGICKIKGSITVNAAGTLTVQFAQNAANANPSSVLVGSQFKLERIQ